jgi:FixJ family two-component response regulator
LFLGTAKDNMLDASKKGRFPNQKGSFNRASKIKDDDAKEIIRRIMVGENNKKIANDFPISHSQVSLIRRGKAWRELSELMGYEVQEKYQSIKVSV